MSPPRQNPMDHLQSPKELFIFVRNGAIVAFVPTVLLFWDSPHTAQEISVAIAVPLIIFNCIPFLFAGLVKGIVVIVSIWFPRNPTPELPFPTSTITSISDLPPKQQMIVRIALRVVLGMVICFFAGIAILLASLAYDSLSIPWAIAPAHYLAYLLLGISVFPIVACFSFLAGAYYAGQFRNRAGAFARAVDPLAHWPTTA